MSQFYRIECDGKVVRAGWNPGDRRAVGRMESVLARFTAGEITLEDARWLAIALRKFLGGNQSVLRDKIRAAATTGRK